MQALGLIVCLPHGRGTEVWSVGVGVVWTVLVPARAGPALQSTVGPHFSWATFPRASSLRHTHAAARQTPGELRVPASTLHASSYYCVHVCVPKQAACREAATCNPPWRTQPCICLSPPCCVQRDDDHNALVDTDVRVWHHCKSRHAATTAGVQLHPTPPSTFHAPCTTRPHTAAGQASGRWAGCSTQRVGQEDAHAVHTR